MASDYGLSATQRLQYLQNLFTGEALHYYNKSVKGQSITVGEAINKMRDQFNLLDAQQRVKADLASANLKNFTEQNKGSTRKGRRALTQ